MSLNKLKRILMNIYARSLSHKMVTCALVLILTGIINCINGQNKITVEIEIDTSKWAPVAYLSLIPDFGNMNTISYSHIIEESSVNENGIYEFSTEYIPESEHLYRIHFSKKNDPPASLIIGGKDHNHLFFFASRKSSIQIMVSQGMNLINNINYNGYKTNLSLHYLNDKIESIDSLDRRGNYVNRKYALKNVYDDIRGFADTSSFPLLSLYAIYNTDFREYYEENPGFYRRFLNRWRTNKSLYYREFRKSLKGEAKPVWVFVIPAMILTALLIILFFIIRKRNAAKQMNQLAELTIQERKILDLLKQGKSNKEIADQFSISVSTVKSHVNSIYSKLSIKSRKEIMSLEY